MYKFEYIRGVLLITANLTRLGEIDKKTILNAIDYVKNKLHSMGITSYVLCFAGVE